MKNYKSYHIGEELSKTQQTNVERQANQHKTTRF